MTAIDIRTLIFTAFFANLVMACLMLSYWMRTKTVRGFGYLTLSHFLSALIYVLLALRGSVPDFISIIMSNLTIALVCAFRIEGIRLFETGKVRKWIFFALPATLLPLSLYYTYINNSQFYRTMFINTMMLLVIIQIVSLLWGKSRQPGNAIYKIAITVNLLYALIIILRMFSWLIQPEHRDFLLPSTINTVFFLVVMLHDIAIAMIFLMLGTYRLMSELTVAHSNLEQLNENLRDQVKEETNKRVLHERLMAHNARLVALGEMLGIIAHQWRQPLATLGITIQRLDLLHRQGKLTSSEMTGARSMSMEQIHHLSETIDEFRRFYLPDRTREFFDPAVACRSAILLIESQLTVNGILLNQQIESSSMAPRLNGYPNQFKQIIVNLLVNAHHAILTRRSHDNENKPFGLIRLTLDADQDCWKMVIEDDGCGISAVDREHIFEPFFTTKESSGGTGIGLYLTRNLVADNFNGQINFTSQPGRTVFTVTIPHGKFGAEHE